MKFRSSKWTESTLSKKSDVNVFSKTQISKCWKYSLGSSSAFSVFLFYFFTTVFFCQSVFVCKTNVNECVCLSKFMHYYFMGWSNRFVYRESCWLEFVLCLFVWCVRPHFMIIVYWFSVKKKEKKRVYILYIHNFFAVFFLVLVFYYYEMYVNFFVIDEFDCVRFLFLFFFLFTTCSVLCQINSNLILKMAK